jgi:hypothetical protein
LAQTPPKPVSPIAPTASEKIKPLTAAVNREQPDMKAVRAQTQKTDLRLAEIKKRT